MEFMGLIIGAIGRLLWISERTFGFYKMHETPWVAEEYLASKIENGEWRLLRYVPLKDRTMCGW
jgi:hypothetical protein